MTVKAALYVRVSTHDQNPAMQLFELRRLAEQRGWVVEREYVDHGISGSKDRRPQLDLLMEAAHCGKLNVVAVWRFDRFARSVRHLVTALDEFRARGIDFVSLHDGIDTSSAAGRFTFHVISAVCELERELVRDRTRAGIAAARRRGARIGRPPVHIDLERALAMRADGKSFREIARALGVGLTTVFRALQNDSDGETPNSSPE